MLARVIFVVALIFVAAPTPWTSPPIALLLGMIFGLTFVHPFAEASRNAARYLLQLSVIGLGFGMNLHQVNSVRCLSGCRVAQDHVHGTTAQYLAV